METTLRLLEYPLALRIGLLIALVTFTIWYTRRGLQNGILLALITGMGIFELFKGEGILPIVSLERVVWPLVFVIFVLKRKRGETTRLPLGRVEISMLVFLAVALISMYSHQTYTADAVEGAEPRLSAFLRGFAMPFGLYFMSRRSIKTGSQLRSFLVGLGCVSGYLILTGIAEALKINWLVFPRFILDPDIGTHYGQVRGIFLNASQYGLAVTMTLPILLWLFLSDIRLHRWLWASIAILALIPLALTVQRAVWIGVLAAVVLTAFAWPRRRIVLIWSVMVVAAVSFFAISNTLAQKMETKLEDKEPVDFRLEMLRTAAAMVREKPLTGVGFNRFGEEADNYSSGQYGLWASKASSAHNTFMTIFAELGLLGFLPFIGIFLFLILASLQIFWHKPQFRAIVGVLWGITASFLIMMISVDMRGNLYPVGLLFALWGMVPELVCKQSIETAESIQKS